MCFFKIAAKKIGLKDLDSPEIMSLFKEKK
jgi:hypothetical protein